jgi:WD40 repeat protein
VKFRFSPDSKTLSSAAMGQWNGKTERIVHLWDVATGRVRRKIKVPKGFRDIAFSSDSRLVATIGSNAGVREVPTGTVYSRNQGEISLWDVGTGALRRTLKQLPSSGIAATFSPDGKTLAVVNPMLPISVIDAVSGKVVHNLILPSPAVGGSRTSVKARSASLPMLHRVVFSPDGKLVAAADYRSVHLWNAQTGQFLQTIELLVPRRYSGGLTVGDIAFAPDSQSIAIAGKDVTTVTLKDVP